MTSTPSQREIFSQAVIVTCSLCSYVYIFLPGPAHSPKVKYSLTDVIVVCSYGVSFQDQHTLLKWNILSKLLLWLALSAHIQWPFRTSTPSQREIFSLKTVIVACSFCSNMLPFQDQDTLPKRNIFSKLLLWLAVSSHIQWPFRCSTPSQREIFSDSRYCFFFLWSFLSHPPKEKYSLTAIIVSCSYGVSFHTLPKRNILSQLLLWLVCMEFPVRTSTPSQSENILSKLLLWLVHSARI